ncbi:MAG: AAA family ATPase [Myxococcota bacterium]|nr:AAA family ATPase [Myxococcota bacterium]
MASRRNQRPVLEEALDSSEAGMFCAASFAAVLGEYRSGEVPLAEELPAIPVVAFYGFRGGAGRTTALAHVAALLAARQIAVVAVDLDLEAPGLHQVLGCPQLEEGRGVLSLLRLAATVDEDKLDEALRLAPHVVKSALDVGAPIRVLPAGRLTQRYLEQLDDLGVPLWHLIEGQSPLQLLVERIKEELQPQVIFLDCRTGLSGLSASALFHVADVVLCFVPVSAQALDGLELFLTGLKAAQRRRPGRPSPLLVPSMVPEGPEGQRRLADFVHELERRYAEIVLEEPLSDDSPDLSETVPVVARGIEYRRGIALADSLRADFMPRSAGAYQALVEDFDALLEFGNTTPVVSIDAARVLDELDTHAGLKELAFAESTEPKTIVEKFIPPSDYKTILDASSWYVVGSKGSGKTWLWQYLLSDVVRVNVPNATFVAGHGSKESSLSASAMRELEQDKAVGLKKHSLHAAFWLLYAVNRILQHSPSLANPLAKSMSAEEKRLLKELAQAAEPRELQTALTHALSYPRVGTFVEALMRGVDAELLRSTNRHLVLLYDGLDVGFGSDHASIERRKRFVNGLVSALEGLRGVCKRVAFKVFLREDIFGEIDIQNQSHLSAATIQLRWRPGDIWQLVLNLVSASPTFMEYVHAIEPTASPNHWPQEEQRLKQLLALLWGGAMEKGNKVSTANFVQRRTADGKDRLFPRTLVQLLEKSVEAQRSRPSMPDRVLRSVAIQDGFNAASTARVDDLRKEYVTLAPYLEAMREMNPTGTEAEIIKYVEKRFREGTISRKGSKGAPAGALHAGPGGWSKVIERLLEIGVLREYKRKGEGGTKKYEIALLYRPGLGIK